MKAFLGRLKHLALEVICGLREIDDFYSSICLPDGRYVMRFEPSEVVADEMIEQMIREANKDIHGAFVKKIDSDTLKLLDHLHAAAIGINPIYL